MKSVQSQINCAVLELIPQTKRRIILKHNEESTLLPKVIPDGLEGLFSWLALGPGGGEAWLSSVLQVGLILPYPTA